MIHWTTHGLGWVVRRAPRCSPARHAWEFFETNHPRDLELCPDIDTADPYWTIWPQYASRFWREDDAVACVVVHGGCVVSAAQAFRDAGIEPTDPKEAELLRKAYDDAAADDQLRAESPVVADLSIVLRRGPA